MTRRRTIRWAVLVTVIVMLELICRLGLVRPTDLVPPTAMVRAMLTELVRGPTLYDLGLTLWSVLASVVIAAVLGIIAGIVLHAMPKVRRACEPLIASYYALPLFALYPMLVVIFGVGPTPIIFTGVLY